MSSNIAAPLQIHGRTEFLAHIAMSLCHLWLPPPLSRPCLPCSGGFMVSCGQPSPHSFCRPESSHEAAKGQARRGMHLITAAAAAPRTPAAATSPRESHKIFDEVSIVVRHASQPSQASSCLDRPVATVCGHVGVSQKSSQTAPQAQCCTDCLPYLLPTYTGRPSIKPCAASVSTASYTHADW